MKMKYISEDCARKLKEIFIDDQYVMQIVKRIAQAGGRAILVGGAVRDLLLGLPIKDLDIEVHGLTQDQLHDILKQFGPVSLVGKAFGVFRVHNIRDNIKTDNKLNRDFDIDWSLPRTDSSGRKPEVQVDPFMSIEEAFRRRDLTINAMGIDLMSSELIDPFNGEKDLKNKILRAPDSELFIQDPLRFYRVMQFIGRFEMQPDNKLNNICEHMDIKNISRERIEEEFKKLFLKSEKPSLGINWLRKINRIYEVLPELADTIDVPQEPEWHPEGDVYEHSMQALDAAASFDYQGQDQKLILLWAALCHDLGKTVTTIFNENKNRYTSYGHEDESEKLAYKLLKRITENNDLIKSVCKLVKYHMQPGQFVKNGAKPAAYKRLALKLMPYANMEMLATLLLADRSGRNPQRGSPLTGNILIVDQFLNKINKLNILKAPEESVLTGKDLINEIEPGPEMGKFLKKAYEIQLEEGIMDKDELKKRIFKD